MFKILTSTVIITSCLVIFMVANSNPSSFRRSASATEVVVPPPVPNVATDPKFKEIKGELLPGFPAEFPIYPQALLEASAKTSPEGEVNKGFRVSWFVAASVPDAMKWYQSELPKYGWEIEPANDPDSPGEQIVGISNALYTGNLAIEDEEMIRTKVVVDIQKI